MFSAEKGCVGVSKSSFSYNNAKQGGAIYNKGSLTTISSTFTGNTAIEDGGAVYNDGILKDSKSTYKSNNSVNGGAIYGTNSGMMVIS